MSKIVLKLMISAFAIIIASIINYLLLKNKKKYFRLVFTMICFVEALYLLIEYFLLYTKLIDFIASQLLLTFLLSITFEDVLINKIDLRIVIVFFIIFVLYRVLFFDFDIILEGLFGFLFCLVILSIPFVIKRELVGFGDILSVSACGMIIGYPSIVSFLFKTFLFVFLFGLFLIIFRKRKFMTEIPLAPFLLLATII